MLVVSSIETQSQYVTPVLASDSLALAIPHYVIFSLFFVKKKKNLDYTFPLFDCIRTEVNRKHGV